MARQGGGEGDLADIRERLLSRAAHQEIGFERDFLITEFEEIVDRMGVDAEDACLPTVRSGRPRPGRKRRKRLWRKAPKSP